MKTISLKAYRYLKKLVKQQYYNQNDIALKREAANILGNIGKEVCIALTSTEYDKLTQEERRLLPNPVFMNTLEDIQPQNAISETKDISNILPSTQLVITLSEYKAIEQELNKGTAKQRIAGHNKLARAHVKITQEELEDLNKQIDQIDQKEKARRARNILNNSILVLTLTEMKELKSKPGKSGLVDKLNFMIIDETEKEKKYLSFSIAEVQQGIEGVPVKEMREAAKIEGNTAQLIEGGDIIGGY